MVQSVRSFGLAGVRGYEVQVECFISGGLPEMNVVGLPDAAIREARDRIRAAVKSCGLRFPQSRVTVNLAPAGQKKMGTVYDLPIALGVLSAAGELPPLPATAACVGELSLSGELRGVAGMLPMALAAVRAGVETLYVPRANAAEAALADAGLCVVPAGSLSELAAHLRGETTLARLDYVPPALTHGGGPDMAEVRGQENVKRALEIAAAGGHNLLMCGFPGSGKSMLAKRLPGILPDMSMEEAMETTEIYSVMGLTRADRPLVTERPFRAPHHGASAASLTGGGNPPRPGELSLAHNGVLFLDELPEFRRDVLEALRQPLENGEITVSRASGSETYPGRFALVCAMNPCRCGWYGHPSGRCTCTRQAVEHYVERISGPLLDRIDLQVRVASVEYQDMAAKATGERSETIRARVNAARALQRRRFAGTNIRCNAQMGRAETERWCALDAAGEKLMRGAFDRLGLTARGYDKLLRVARTIADLAGGGDLRAEHLAEALQYRDAI